MILTTNDSWPGKLPVGTEVKLVGQTQASVLVRIGRKTVKASPKRLDWPSDDPFRARPLRTATDGVLS